MNKNIYLKQEIKITNNINRIVEQNINKIKRDNIIFNNVQNILFDNNKDERNNNIYKNIFPYVLIGIVESIFIDEESNKKQKVLSTGLIIGDNTALVSSRSLIYDTNKTIDKNTFNPDVSKVKLYKLFEITFSPMNMSKEFTVLFPDKINIIDYYSPALEILNQSKENINIDSILNNWGIVTLDQPIGKFIKYINKNKIQFKESNYHFDNLLSFDDLENSEISSSNLIFAEFINKKYINLDKEIELDYSNFTFLINSYNAKFDNELIFLQNDIKDLEILPGFIIVEYKCIFYLIGMNSDLMISNEEQNGISNRNKILRIATRFNKQKLKQIHESKLQLELESNIHNIFNSDIFKILNIKIQNRKQLFDYLKNNCKTLINLFNELKYDDHHKKYRFIYNNLLIDSLDVRYSFSLIWNKFNYEGLDKNIIDLNSLDISLNGSILINEILKYKTDLSILNLSNCSLFAEGIKNILKSIYNTKQIHIIGKSLHQIDLSSNKLSDKAIKYLRHLIKNCHELSVLSLKNNYISHKGLDYLLNSLKQKGNLQSLDLSFNLLSSKSNAYLEYIIANLPSLSILNLESNNIGDESIISINKGIRKNNKLENFNISSNNITDIDNIFRIITKCENLNSLKLNGNQFIFKDKAILEIKEKLNRSPLVEINLNSCSLNLNLIERIFTYFYCLGNLQHISLNRNNLDDLCCEIISKYLIDKGELINYLNLSHNKITDNGAKNLMLPIQYLPNLKYINLNSNLITDEGGELLVFAVLNNSNIEIFSLENNNINWQSGINFKKNRKNISILY